MESNPSQELSGQPAEHGSQDRDERPDLLADRSFWGINLTQFLGAFNDNVYKQLVLLLALPTAAAASDMQGWATFTFSLPFVLFSPFAGYLSDRFSKTPIIVYCKVAEIAVMLLGMLAFLFYQSWGMLGTWTVLFLMGMHSTFFGPGKYGILPELFRPKDLARANGLILMATFLAIIFGVICAGGLFDATVVKNEQGEVVGMGQLWIGSLICVAIAVAGTLTSTFIGRTSAAQPEAVLTIRDFGISKEITDLFRHDRPLLVALLVSCVFWMVSSITMPTVNRLGVDMLKLSMANTGTLVGMIAVGIMLGGPLGGWLCRKFSNHRLVTTGLWGIVFSLTLLGVWQSGENGDQLWLSSGACHVVLIGLGVSAAIYSIPLQVFLQERPPAALKGRMIATMNQANFAGMLIAGPLYQLFEQISRWMSWPVSSVFFMIALLVLPLAIFYRLGDQPTNALQSQ